MTKNVVNAILGKFGLKLARVGAQVDNIDQIIARAVESAVKNYVLPTVDFAVLQERNQQYAFSLALEAISMTQLTNLLNKIPFYGDKMKFVGLFVYDRASSKYRIQASTENESIIREIFERSDIDRDIFLSLLNRVRGTMNDVSDADLARIEQFDKLNLACGSNFLEGWLNVDFSADPRPDYLQLNLCEKLPFRGDSIRYIFAEDFFEHISQDDSIIFLSECYRCLIDGGVLRLSFPGLEGVLKKHYLRETGDLTVYEGKIDAYLYWDHLHFYSLEELRTVASHIGYRETRAVEAPLAVSNSPTFGRSNSSRQDELIISHRCCRAQCARQLL